MRSVDPVLCEVVAEGPLADAHRLGGVLLDAARLFERAADRLALHPFEVLMEPQRRQTRSTCVDVAPRSEIDCCVSTGPGREHDRALDGVLQLAHVARPVVALQRFDDVRLDAIDRACRSAADASRRSAR